MATSTGQQDLSKYIGFPCVCHTEYRPLAANGPNFLEVKPDTQCKIEDVHVQQNRLWVKVIDLRGNRRGWAPFANFRVGTERKYGDVTVEGIARVPLIQSTAQQFQGTLLFNAIAGLLSAYGQRQKDMFLGNWINAYVQNDQVIRSTTAKLIDGMKDAGTLDILSKPGFSCKEFVDSITGPKKNSDQTRPPPWTRVDARPCIYIIVYWNLPNQPSRRCIYVGKTVHFGSRMDQHQLSSAMESLHYSVRREAQEFKALPVCILKDDEDLRQIGEQIFTDLLETMAPEVVQPKLKSRSHFHSIGNHYKAGVSVDLRNQVKADTHWIGGCSRPSFGVSNGLNWTVPIMEVYNNEKTLWIETLTSDGGSAFRRTPAAAFTIPTRQSRITEVFQILSHVPQNVKGDFPDHFRITTAEKEPRPGTDVHPIVEIAPNGKEHPHAWARLPSVGQWSDWKTANQLAIRIEWQDETGKWYQRYAQTGKGALRPRTGRSGDAEPYLWATAIIRAFRRQTLNFKPNWYHDLGLMWVKRAPFDFLKQKYTLLDVPHSVVAPPTLDLDRVRRELKEAATPVTKVDPPFGTTRPSGRQECDGCLKSTPQFSTDFKVETYGGCVQADRDDGKGKENRCRPCKLIGRVCTWTPTHLLLNSKSLKDALFIRPISQKSLETEDPRLMEGVLG